MPILPENTSLICPRNDLESQTILEIGKKLGLDVKKIDGQWGLTLDTALKQIPHPKELREHVITIELPDHKKLATLQKLGKQVHVIDHHSDEETATPLPSSLEQFATLLDYELSKEEYKIAINDRDFLPGLSKAGVNLEKAKSLRQQELDLRDQTDNMQEAKQFIEQNKRELYDLQFILAPKKFAGVMLEALQWPTDEDYIEAAEERYPVKLKPTLILYHAEQRKDICQIMYAGPAKQRKKLSKLRKLWQNDFNLWAGGGKYNCFLGAKRKSSFSDVNSFVSELLNICLQMGRPLRHYGCTFYLPLDLFSEDDLANDSSLSLPITETKNIKRHNLNIKANILKDDIDSVESHEKQAYLYFLPHLRDMVFDIETSKSSIEPIKHWQLQHNDMTMELGIDEPIVVKLTDVSLYCYFNDTYILSISVQPTVELDSDSSLHSDNTNWWYDLFFTSETEFHKITNLQLHQWLHFTNQARIIYPSFKEQVFEGKITFITLKKDQEIVAEFKHENEISPIILYLLEQFFSNNKEQLEQRLYHLPDDRMAVLPAYGLAGKPLQQEDIKRLFSLALYVDRDSDTFDDLSDYAYDPKFVNRLLERDSLGRWNELGNYSGCCAYANVYLGFGYFFNRVIAPSHVPYIYGRMFLLALFYQMALLHYNRQINYATHQLSENKKTDGFQKLRKEFIRFTNSYWFREVSSQVQGIEVFDLQTKALRLEEEYSLIKDEMERADEYSDALNSRKLNNQLRWLAIIATIATIIGATAAWSSIMELKDWILSFF